MILNQEGNEAVTAIKEATCIHDIFFYKTMFFLKKKNFLKTEEGEGGKWVGVAGEKSI